MLNPFPLKWPASYPRTMLRKPAKFKTTLHDATKGLINELKRLGAEEIVISSNAPLRGDGLPYADWFKAKITDHGVAVYFKYNDRDIVMCCDKWDNVASNTRALALSVEAIRGLDRWGVSDMLNRAFAGFEALPPTTPWWEVLQVVEFAKPEEVKAAYRLRIKETHPDQGGNAIEFQRVQKAWEEYQNLPVKI